MGNFLTREKSKIFTITGAISLNTVAYGAKIALERDTFIQVRILTLLVLGNY